MSDQNTAAVEENEEAVEENEEAVEENEEAVENKEDFFIKVDPDIVISFMNEILEKDPDAIKSLIVYRVPCNEDLLKHNTVQVLCDADGEGNPINPNVGMLGVLNGLVGKHETGWGYLAAEFDEDGNLHRFVRTPQTVEKEE